MCIPPKYISRSTQHTHSTHTPIHTLRLLSGDGNNITWQGLQTNKHVLIHKTWLVWYHTLSSPITHTLHRAREKGYCVTRGIYIASTGASVFKPSLLLHSGGTSDGEENTTVITYHIIPGGQLNHHQYHISSITLKLQLDPFSQREPRGLGYY